MTRIFVDSGGHDAANLGDAAMLQVALGRLRARWPDARIACHTANPGWVRGVDPDVVPIDPGGAHAWCLDGAIVSRRGGQPDRAGFALAAGDGLRRHAPRLAAIVAGLASRASGRRGDAVRRYLREVAEADLVIMAGAGAITDAFAWHALEVLETLALGHAAGAVTALVGQGIGPITDRTLARRARRVLPTVDLIALRDEAASRPVVLAMGVSAARVVVTGDDALALVTREPTASSSEAGAALGVNLRSAPYAGLPRDLIAAIADTVRAEARRRQAAVVALPVDRHAETDDLETVRACLDDDAGIASAADPPSTPEALARRVTACRAAICGSYHAAVFALGAGVPVVAIAASAYYAHKFAGLAALFGAACRVVRADQPALQPRLAAAIDAAWQEPAPVRAALRASARQQVAAGEAAMDRIAALVTARAATSR